MITSWDQAQTTTSHTLLNTEQLARCKQCLFVYFSVSISSRHPLLEGKYRTRWWRICFTPHRQSQENTELPQHIQRGGKPGLAKILVLLHGTQTHAVGLLQSKNIPPATWMILRFCCFSHWWYPRGWQQHSSGKHVMYGDRLLLKWVHLCGVLEQTILNEYHHIHMHVMTACL